MRCLWIILIFVGMANCQVNYLEEWFDSDSTFGGARGVARFSGLGDGTCNLTFPGKVEWFHCENCDIVPKESNSDQGVYALATPNKKLENSGIFTFVVTFLRTHYFQDDVSLDCDPSTVNDVTVFSFPNHRESKGKRIMSHLRRNKNKLTDNRVITLELPEDVQEFKVEPPNRVFGEKRYFQITNIEPEQIVIPFTLKYNPSSWFSASDIAIDEPKLSNNYRRQRRDVRY